MERTSSLVVAAGIAGAVLATVLNAGLSIPAWGSGGGSAAAEEPARVAVVDVLGVLERMLDAEPYVSTRNATAETWNQQIQTMVAERDDLVQSLSQMQAEDPGAQGLYQQYQSLQQRIQSLSQEAQQAIDATSAQQLSDAYKKIHAVVQTVATREGYDRVFSSRMTVDDLNAQNTNVVVQEVLLRPVLMNEPKNDITELVITELDLPEVAPEAEGQGLTPGFEGGLELPGDEPPAGAGGQGGGQGGGGGGE